MPNVVFQVIDHPYVIFAREIYVWLVPVMVTILIVINFLLKNYKQIRYQ